jgi:hypothetical protein
MMRCDLSMHLAIIITSEQTNSYCTIVLSLHIPSTAPISLLFLSLRTPLFLYLSFVPFRHDDLCSSRSTDRHPQ